MLQRSLRNGYSAKNSQVSMDVLHKLASAGACTAGERSAPGYRKWGLLLSFLLTAALLLIYLCLSSARPQSHLQTSTSTTLTEQEFQDDSPSTFSKNVGFQDSADAYRLWDRSVGCSRFLKNHRNLTRTTTTTLSRPARLQDPSSTSCSQLQMMHVNVRVQSWTWIPDNLENIYSCSCGLTCLWTKSTALADQPDALFYEWNKPPEKRTRGDPLRVYIDLEPGRQRAPSQDIFVSYHGSSDVQTTYAGALFHNSRSYYTSTVKKKDVLVYWSSSRCLPKRQEIASKFLPLITHHSFGKCLNNVGGADAALDMYPECHQPGQDEAWNQHLHCAMSHYKFVLAIENTMKESYVTEKLFYALDAGSVPIYFGAPNVLDFVPPKSVIVGTDFSSMEELSKYVQELAEDPVRYAEFHAWRRCGVVGNYYWTRALSLDTLPCRLCALVSKMGGKSY